MTVKGWLRPRAFHAAFDDAECENVDAFHEKFGQLRSDEPTHLTKRKLAERANFMLEELLEFAAGAGLYLAPAAAGVAPAFKPHDGAEQDMETQADALVDLCYVLKGTVTMMGLPWRALWDDVHRANMSKVKGATHRNMGFGADIAKPPGWRGPETRLILEEAGYSRLRFCSLDSPDDPRVYVVDDAKCLDDKGAKEVKK